MTRTILSVAMLFGLAPTLFAQAVAPPAESLPPLNVPTAVTVEQLPNGTTVSQPLQPVTSEPVVSVPSAQPAPMQVIGPVEPAVARPFANSWNSAEVLMWWSKSAKLPPLVTTNATLLPALDNPSTLVLFGGKRPEPTGSVGGQFRMGWAVGSGRAAGFEIGYQFLGTQSVIDTFRNNGTVFEPYLGIPLRNAVTGLEDVVMIGSPGQAARLDVTQSSRLQGWELTALGNLHNGEGVKVHALAGYRYLMFNEGVRLDLRSSLSGQVASTVPGVGPTNVVLRSAVADQFDAHNRFHGAQLGLRTEFERRGFFAEVDTKVSFGRSVEVVRVSGQTVAVADLPTGPAAFNYYPSGIFGQPTNAGRADRSVFAVLPEAAVKFGFRFGDKSRFFVGYNFLYLSHAVRAADQFDRSVDLSQSRPLDPLALVVPSTRPFLPFDKSDFWVQGLSFGLEWRY
jgi:Putative beta barrel porin-7 (BBP7)